MNKNELISVLESTSAFIEKDKKHKLERRNIGGEFNLFEVLGINSKEVLHSKFIAELLNTNGKHGMKDVFLNEFLKIKGIFKNFDTLNSCAFTERYVGEMYHDDSNSEGGRIDILVESPKEMIVIENKIYASDEENQLVRYHNYCKSTDKNFRLIYLTLNGSAPSDYSKRELKDNSDYLCLSYKDDILKWLNECIKLVYDKPYIRENLNQYIETIKQLTYQDMDKEAQEKLFEQIAKPEKIESYIELKNMWGYFQSYVIEKNLKPALENLASKYELKLFIDDAFLHSEDKETEFYFWKNDWEKLSISFRTENKNWSNFYVSLSYRKGVDADKVLKHRINCFTDEPTENCPYGWKYLEEKYLNWNDNSLLDILNGEYVKYIEVCLTEVLSAIKVDNNVYLRRNFGIGGNNNQNTNI